MKVRSRLYVSLKLAILTFTSSWLATSRLSCLRLHPMRRSTSMLRVSPSVFLPSR